MVLASLLAMRPPHLVLDEPTAQLDPEGTRLVGEALRGLARTGTALLIAEHKTDLLDGLCSRVIVLDAGQVVLDGRLPRSSPTQGWPVGRGAAVAVRLARAADSARPRSRW